MLAATSRPVHMTYCTDACSHCHSAARVCTRRRHPSLLAYLNIVSDSYTSAQSSPVVGHEWTGRSGEDHRTTG